MPIGVYCGQYYTVVFGVYKNAVRIAQNEAISNGSPRYVVPCEGGYRLAKEPPAGVENVTTVRATGEFTVPPALFHEYPI